MDDPNIRFSEDHIWLVEMGETARIGLSDYAQEQLGEIVHITAAEVGRLLEPGETFAEVESQKTIVELPSPITGTVRAVNEDVIEDPSLINVDPYGKGWILEVEIHEPEDIERLMSAEEYETFSEE